MKNKISRHLDLANPTDEVGELMERAKRKSRSGRGGSMGKDANDGSKIRAKYTKDGNMVIKVTK